MSDKKMQICSLISDLYGQTQDLLVSLQEVDLPGPVKEQVEEIQEKLDRISDLTE